MTTPTAPAVTVSTDKASYNVGDPITVTVEYADPANPGTALTVTATVTGSDGSLITGTAQVQVGGAAAVPLPVAVTDSFGSVYVTQSNVAGTAVFTSTVSPVPAGA